MSSKNIIKAVIQMVDPVESVSDKIYINNIRRNDKLIIPIHHLYISHTINSFPHLFHNPSLTLLCI